MSRPAELKVLEIFRAFQGEGSRVGEMCLFIRLFGCNLRCAWCDTAYSINQTEHKKSGIDGEAFKTMEVLELADEGSRYGSVVITGGEPMLQYESVMLLIGELHRLHPTIKTTVETNGTLSLMGRVRDPRRHLWSISPKLQSASAGEGRAHVDLQVIRDYLGAAFSGGGSVQLKFVISSYNDLREARGYILHDLNDLITDLTPIVFQPNSAPFWPASGTALSPERLEDYLHELAVLQRRVRDMFGTYKYLDIRVLPQLHFLLHGSRRLV